MSAAYTKPLGELGIKLKSGEAKNATDLGRHGSGNIFHSPLTVGEGTGRFINQL